MNDAEENISDLQSRLDELEEANASLKDELTVLKGIMQVNDKKINNLDNRVIDLTARSMSNNIVISGISGDNGKEKDCKEKVLALM